MLQSELPQSLTLSCSLDHLAILAHFSQQAWPKLVKFFSLRNRLSSVHMNPISLELDQKQESYGPMNLTQLWCQHAEV